MIAPNSSIINQPISLNDIPRFREKPITKVPDYVFGNCNQVTCNNYTSDFLPKIKHTAKTITADVLKKWVNEDEVQFKKKGEELDWVNGWHKLEKLLMKFHLLNPDQLPDQLMEEILKVETVLRYNGIFSRFANDNPGKFRTDNMTWTNRDLEVNEVIASSIFQQEFEKHFGCPIGEFFANKQNAKLHYFVKKVWVLNKIKEFFAPGVDFKGEASNIKYIKKHWDEVNFDKAASTWIEEQNSKNGKLDLVAWFKTRYHYFPLASNIEKDLENSLKEVKEAKDMHPIEKACKVWFDIVRIHISHEANKRTAKALAALILLSYGYLPPKISAEDAKEYVEALQKGLEEEKGHLRLTNFVAKMILKTQKEYADLVV